MDRENSTHADPSTIRNPRRSISTPFSHTAHLTNMIQILEWRQRLRNHLLEENSIYRSSHSSELKHAQSAIADFAATATYVIPAYVTDAYVLKAIPEPPVWFTELPSDVQSIKLEEGRAMYSIWTEAVEWLNHAPSEVVGPITRTSPGVDMSSILDVIGAAMSTLETLGMDDFLVATATRGDGAVMSTEVASTVITSTGTAMDDGVPTAVANAAGEERVGVTVAVMAGVAVVAVVLL
jgi:hypothetical protein